MLNQPMTFATVLETQHNNTKIWRHFVTLRQIFFSTFHHNRIFLFLRWCHVCSEQIRGDKDSWCMGQLEKNKSLEVNTGAKVQAIINEANKIFLIKSEADSVAETHSSPVDRSKCHRRSKLSFCLQCTFRRLCYFLSIIILLVHIIVSSCSSDWRMTLTNGAELSTDIEWANAHEAPAIRILSYGACATIVAGVGVTRSSWNKDACIRNWHPSRMHKKEPSQ